MAEEYDYLFKSIVVGDGGVGKTALTLRFSKGFFTEDYKMTIGVDFHVKTIGIDTLDGPIRCKLQLWDTGGQERFSSIRPMYYRGSLGVVLVFDLTNSASFEHLPQWIEEVRANIKAEIPLLLVGNKSDLVDQRVVSIQEINNFTRDFNLYYMETSAKTGEGVGDCFYILACLMIGSGVPEQLIANATVFSPGQISIEEPSVSTTSYQEPEHEVDYSAPPVPEPTPEVQYEAPPVPEPTPEVQYEAPPVPEPTPKIKEDLTPVPLFEPEAEPEISIPEPKEIDFKTPEEILSKKRDQLPSLFPQPESLRTKTGESYRPKAVPFSSNIPVPAPAPEEFRSIQEESPTSTPFRVVKKEEQPKPKPASMTFEPESQPTPKESEVNPLFQPSSAPSTELSSESLIDYMPQTILSKKEKKKAAKDKKREQKEKTKLEKEKKLQEAREKHEKMLEEMKKPRKEKKEKQKKEKEKLATPLMDTKPSSTQKSESSSLFQTLTHKTEDTEPSGSTPFVPFSATTKSDQSGTSKLRIIPNISDIESEPRAFTTFPSTTSVQKEATQPKSKDLMICEQCGAILSADYAFCNKCGNKL